MRFACVLGLCVLAAQSVAAREISGVPEITDADTVYIGKFEVRLAGVDAPESDQVCLDGSGQTWSCGAEARTALQNYSNGRSWVCTLSGLDRFGRHLGTCSVGNDNVGRWLVRGGWALAFTRYS